MSEGKAVEKKSEGQGATGAEAKKEGAGSHPVRLSYAADLASRAVFADGIHGVSVRGGVARIDLYQAVLPGDDTQPEQRVVTHRLVLPLPALGELAAMLTSMRQALQKATEQQGGAK